MGKYDDYKQQVLRVSQTLSAQGYFGTKNGTAGNVSMLIESEEAIAVTPSSRKYGDMTADDICIVDFDRSKIEGPYEPSVETPMHIAVYQNRKDANAVIHSHPMHTSVLAVLNEPIPPLFDETVVALGNLIEVIPYALSGSPELLANVVAKLANRGHCYILQNHGALCIAKNMDKAVAYLELLEKNAAVYCMAMATGKPIVPLPELLATALTGIAHASQDMEIARKENLG